MVLSTLSPKAPLEILARGPKAKEAYIKAIQEGKTRVFRTRLMIVGQERVGKTSLKKSLTGEPFYTNEEPTDGIDTSHTRDITIDFGQTSGETWSLQDDESVRDKPKHAIVDETMKILRDESKLVSILGESSTGNKPAFKDYEDMQFKEMSLEVANLLQEKAYFSSIRPASQGKTDSINFDIWDFAGHELYYTTHQVFLSRRAIYLLAFDLSKDLDEMVTVEDTNFEVKGGSKSDLTRLQFINFWISSIVAHSTRPGGGDSSPPIFIVGTHRNNVIGDKEAKIQRKFARIRRCLSGKPYVNHVVPEYYAIENSLGSGDEKIKALQKHILEVAREEPYMGEEIPLRWLQFEEEIEKHKDDPVKDMSQTKELLSKLSIATDPQSLQTMLTFYHDLGKIVFFGKLNEANNSLNDLVILDPVWLIGVFKKVVTIMRPYKMPRKLNADWDALNKGGILTKGLLDYVWRQFEPSMKLKLIDLMKKFDLICDAPYNPTGHQPCTSSQDQKRMQVPSMLSPRCTAQKEKDLDSLAFVEFYVDIDCIFTVNLFHRLMSRMCAANDYGKVELYYRQIFMSCGPEHSALLEILPPPEFLMKVRVYRLSKAGDRTEKQCKPDPKVVAQVREEVSEVVEKMCRDVLGTDANNLSFFAKCPEQGCGNKLQLELCCKGKMGDSVHCDFTHSVDLRALMHEHGFSLVTGGTSEHNRHCRPSASEGKCGESSTMSDIYLLHGKDGAEVRKVNEIIKRNGWSVRTPRDGKLGQLRSKARKDGVKRSRHVVIVLTEDYIKELNFMDKLTLEMALQSEDKNIISIVCCDRAIPDTLKSFETARIDDDDLEQRLRLTINSQEATPST